MRTMAESAAMQSRTGQARMHWPCLLMALAIMLIGSFYPPFLVGAEGRSDHLAAMLLFWAMAAGFVRGVGFVPRGRSWRAALSGTACAVAVTSAAWVRWGS